jgi:hypothetical protein
MHTLLLLLLLLHLLTLLLLLLLQVLEVMWDESVGLCLTPQAFSNIPQAGDLWNNINLQFWENILPGLDALG